MNKLLARLIAFYHLLCRFLDPIRREQAEALRHQQLLLDLDLRICTIEKMLHDLHACPILDRNMKPERDFLLSTLETQLTDLHSFRAKVARWK